MMLSRNLNLCGGRLLADSTLKTPTSNHFPWEDLVGDMNTPDIDPSFFTDDPFKKLGHKELPDPTMLMGKLNPEVAVKKLMQPDDCFVDLAQLINHDESVNCDAPSPESTTVFHVLEAPVSMEDSAEEDQIASQNQMTIEVPSASLVNDHQLASIQVFTTLDTHQFLSASCSPAPSTSGQSYPSTDSPAPSSYFAPSPSASSTTTINEADIDIKPQLMVNYMHPTVIDDHLYTLPVAKTPSNSKDNNDNKYLTIRTKNNAASKRSRMSKRDKQKQMEEKIQFYLEDNAKCQRQIDEMERQIKFCKDYLFNKVMQAAKPQRT